MHLTRIYACRDIYDKAISNLHWFFCTCNLQGELLNQKGNLKFFNEVQGIVLDWSLNSAFAKLAFMKRGCDHNFSD